MKASWEGRWQCKCEFGSFKLCQMIQWLIGRYTYSEEENSRLKKLVSTFKENGEPEKKLSKLLKSVVVRSRGIKTMKASQRKLGENFGSRIEKEIRKSQWCGSESQKCASKLGNKEQHIYFELDDRSLVADDDESVAKKMNPKGIHQKLKQQQDNFL